MSKLPSIQEVRPAPMPYMIRWSQISAQSASGWWTWTCPGCSLDYALEDGETPQEIMLQPFCGDCVVKRKAKARLSQGGQLDLFGDVA